MQNELTNDVKALHAAALTLSTKMLASQSHEQINYLEQATKQGAKIIIQLGPLPDCQRIELVLLEREGQRSVIASMGASHD